MLVPFKVGDILIHKRCESNENKTVNFTEEFEQQFK